jgi:hypothetical protein
MQSQISYSYDPIQELLYRYRFLFVLVIGFCGAFLLGLLLWNLSGWAATADTSSHAGAPPPAKEAESSTETGDPPPPVVAEPASAITPPTSTLSPVFTAEVRKWETEILAWAAERELDPDLVATLIQIESCGNPQAISSAGAQGLFQVMPFHFSQGEDMLEPATNARRGLDYLVNSLSLTEGHVGMALAGYNGGHVAAQGTWETWPLETRRYYRWGSGIYHDASTGLKDSPTLHDWLTAGGASLCQSAADVLAVSGG